MLGGRSEATIARKSQVTQSLAGVAPENCSFLSRK